MPPLSLPRIALIAALGLAGLAAAPSAAQTAPLAGAWRGSGLMQADDGRRERVLCRAFYERSGQDQYRVSMKCVSRNKISRARIFTVKKTGKAKFSGGFHDQEAKLDIRIAIRLKGARQVVDIMSRRGRGRVELTR